MRNMRSACGMLGLLLIGACVGASVMSLHREQTRRIEIKTGQQVTVHCYPRDGELIIEAEVTAMP